MPWGAIISGAITLGGKVADAIKSKNDSKSSSGSTSFDFSGVNLKIAKEQTGNNFYGMTVEEWVQRHNNGKAPSPVDIGQAVAWVKGKTDSPLYEPEEVASYGVNPFQNVSPSSPHYEVKKEIDKEVVKQSNEGSTSSNGMGMLAVVAAVMMMND